MNDLIDAHLALLNTATAQRNELAGKLNGANARIQELEKQLVELKAAAEANREDRKNRK